MAYLVSVHFTRQRPSPASVRAALPLSLGFTIYKHESFDLFAIDTFRAAKPPRQPFSAATPATDLPTDLPSNLAALNSLYEQLREQGIANGLKRNYVNLSCILSTCLEQPVLSLYTDDEGNDFACRSSRGEVARLVARCGDEVITFENGRVSQEQDETEDLVLHQIAAEEFMAFTEQPGTTIGLGSFDAPETRGFVLDYCS
jgi:hypothetical protein